MKACPHCGHQIRDEAVKCRYCRRDVPATAWPVQAPAGARVGEGALRFSHSGHRHILGYGADFFGIWDREQTGGPVFRFPRTDEGWNEAWNRFAALEPRGMEVPQTGPPPDVRVATAATYVSAHGRATWTVALLATAAAAGAVGIATEAARIGALEAFRRGLGTSPQPAAAPGVQTGIALMGLTLAGGAVAWSVWQHRAQTNLRALGVSGLRFSPGWAVGWWFVPIANYVMPFLTVRELAKASQPGAGALDWKSRPTHPILGFWWGTWIGYTFLRIVGASVAPERVERVSRLVTQAWLLLASDALFVVAGLLAIVIVRSIERYQEAKRAHLASWSASLPVGTVPSWSAAPGPTG